MARFHGLVGYGEQIESPANSGIWVDKVTEYPYFGDVLRNTKRLSEGENLNDNLTLQNTITIVADEHAVKHFHQIVYVFWEGVCWEVSSVEVDRPRLKLYLGTVYNGPRPPVVP